MADKSGVGGSSFGPDNTGGQQFSTPVSTGVTTAPADIAITGSEIVGGIPHDNQLLIAWLATADGSEGAVTHDLAAKPDPIPAGDHVFTFASPNAADDTATLTVVIDLAPTINGLASHSAPENSAFQADYTIDNRNGELPFLSGDDAAFFVITQLGGDSFRLSMTSRNYEAPGDLNADNVYDVIIRISDGINPLVSMPVAVTITDVADGGVGQGGSTVVERSMSVPFVSRTFELSQDSPILKTFKQWPGERWLYSIDYSGVVAEVGASITGYSWASDGSAIISNQRQENNAIIAAIQSIDPGSEEVTLTVSVGDEIIDKQKFRIVTLDE